MRIERREQLESIKREANPRLFARNVHETSKVILKVRFNLGLSVAYLYLQKNGLYRSISYWFDLEPLIGMQGGLSIEEWVVRVGTYLEQDKCLIRKLIKKGMI